MDQQKAGGPSERTGLYVWFTILYVVLTFTVNPVDTIAQATVGKLFAYLRECTENMDAVAPY